MCGPLTADWPAEKDMKTFYFIILRPKCHPFLIIFKTMTDDSKEHKLAHKWTLWAHLPHDPDWTLDSYKKIVTLESVEEAIALIHNTPANMVDNCMLFVMKEGIKPIWEDPKNRTGGCFSYKINNKIVHNVWRNLFFVLLGGTLSRRQGFVDNINGITISPKKNFCIIKVWMASTTYQDPTIISRECGLLPDGCLFKKHEPEY